MPNRREISGICGYATVRNQQPLSLFCKRPCANANRMRYFHCTIAIPEQRNTASSKPAVLTLYLRSNTMTKQTAVVSKSPKALTAKAVKATKVLASTKKLVKPTKDNHTIQPEQKVADAIANKAVKADAMSFAVQQLTTPSAQTPPAALSQYQADLAALQAKHGVVATTKIVKAPKVDKLQQNGITRPADHTTCGIIWKAADEISHAIHGICPIALLKQDASVADINEHTIKTQYARWRAYNGIHGRQPTIPAVHQVVGEYDAALPKNVKSN